MLTSLHIENIAIIDRLDLEFNSGFSVLTGETGAGKSIIIDSILLLLGNKASKDLIRTGAEAGIVSATFCNLTPEANSILNSNDLSCDDDGNITVYRKIGFDGRNTAKINGINVTVSLLKELGSLLVNIHGQHDGVLLLDSHRHIRYLDDFGAIDKREYEEAYAAVKELREQLNEMRVKLAEKEERKAKLAAWIEQLENCSLREGEHEELLQRRKNLMLNTEIVEGLHVASTAVYDGDLAATQLIKEALDALSPIGKHLPNGENLLHRMSQISTELDDLGAELGKLFDDYATDQMDPDEIEKRLDQLEEIKKQFGPTDQDVLSNFQAYQNEIAILDSGEEVVKELEASYIAAHSTLVAAAENLTAEREKASLSMEKQLQEELCYLDMPKVRFQSRVQERRNERGGIRYRYDGKDDVEFFLSANAGESPRPLAKIASGGELSRIMLSMKSVLNQDFDTVIYDEVDTGVSGATADKIGKKLQSGAGDKQVFCITHLAQIAARADHHFKVAKKEVDGRVCSEVTELDHTLRVREVARIMGGEELTDTLLKSAEEIIKNNKK